MLTVATFSANVLILTLVLFCQCFSSIMVIFRVDCLVAKVAVSPFFSPSLKLSFRVIKYLLNISTILNPFCALTSSLSAESVIVLLYTGNSVFDPDLNDHARTTWSVFQWTRNSFTTRVLSLVSNVISFCYCERIGFRVIP